MEDLTKRLLVLVEGAIAEGAGWAYSYQGIAGETKKDFEWEHADELREVVRAVVRELEERRARCEP